MTPTVELSMIVKDGAGTLERCLRSAAPFVDRILIGDTGSTDDTVRIALSFGAEVLSIPWEQDFAQARNRLLQQARCDWILYLDADEMLDPAGGARIRRLIERQEIYGWHHPRWNYVRDRSTRIAWQAAHPNPVLIEDSRAWPAYVALPATRLFRRHRGVYFEGCVHETVTRRLSALKLATAAAEFIVHHFGHAEDGEEGRRSKDALYHELGEKKLRANPDDAQAILEMGLSELEHSRNPQAALGHFERVCQLTPGTATAWLFAAICMVRLGRVPEALARLERAAQLGLETALLQQTIGDAYFQGGQFADARLAYLRLAYLGQASPLSAAKLGACEVHLGLAEEGLRRIQQAIAGAPEYAELYDILAAAALLAGNVPLAAGALEMRLQLAAGTEFHERLRAAIESQQAEAGPAAGFMAEAEQAGSAAI